MCVQIALALFVSLLIFLAKKPGHCLQPGLIYRKTCVACLVIFSPTTWSGMCSCSCRAEKSEVLSEDLLLLEKRVDLIRQVCHNTQKSLSACIQGKGTDVEKRLVSCVSFCTKVASVARASIAITILQFLRYREPPSPPLPLNCRAAVQSNFELVRVLWRSSANILLSVVREGLRPRPHFITRCRKKKPICPRVSLFCCPTQLTISVKSRRVHVKMQTCSSRISKRRRKQHRTR